MLEPLGIYISVPFCKAKCTFCNFASGAFGLERMDGYVDSLVAEIETARARAEGLGTELPNAADSIYFGGGTPSLLNPRQLQMIFSALRGQFDVRPGAEITLECAPGQMGGATLTEVLGQGVNRVSFGVQSFVDAESAAVGRLHTAEQCLAEIARVRAVGIDEISLDLIAGLPRQTADSWETSLDAVIESGVPHASVYMLEVDEESHLGKELIAGGSRYQATAVPSDEAMTEFYERACDRFQVAGLEQYEISNFARRGHESRHNLKYWLRAPYLGFGVDAHSMLRRGVESVRFANADSLEAYAAGMKHDITVVDEDAAFEETLFLGLRRNEGVDLYVLQAMFGKARVEGLSDALQDLEDGGLLRCEGKRLMLTGRGRIVSNDVFGELLRAIA